MYALGAPQETGVVVIAVAAGSAAAAAGLQANDLILRAGEKPVADTKALAGGGVTEILRTQKPMTLRIGAPE